MMTVICPKKSFIIIFVLVQSFLNGIENGSKFRCDYTYFKETKGWLKLHNDPAMWIDAKNTCEYEDATIALLSVKSAMLAMMKTTTVNSVVTAESNVDDCKSGCKLMTSNGDETSLTTDTPNSFFCFRKGEPSVNLTDCGTTDQSYKLNKHTKTCHKLHSSRRDWNTAKTICEAEGGYLVVINDEEEAKISDKLDKRRGPALVGFAFDEKNKFYTVQKESQLYQNYDPLNIDFATNKCGAIENNRNLITVKCDIVYHFFCEKNTTSLACEDNGDIHTTTSKPVEVVTSNYEKTNTSINKPVKSSATAHAVDGLILMVFITLIYFISV